MRSIRAGALIALLCCGACGPKPSEPNAQPADTSSDELTGPAETMLTPTYNLGDVDFATRARMQFAERSRSGNVKYEEIETRRGDLAIVNATVGAPRPAELWVTATIQTPTGYREGDSVLIQVSILLDGRAEALASKSFVWSGKSPMGKPETIEVNLAEFLDPEATSALVQARLQIHWYPETAPETIDQNAVPTGGQVHEKLSNPLRIDFE